jgi:Pvc16 N-terminal domain/Carboxypeptidase regulatory-like domain
VFDDLDSTLTQLLNDAPAVELPQLRNADVSFQTPDSSFAPAQDTVDLFLYEVKENRELRDPTPIVDRVDGTFFRRPPPVRVDCSYITTTWATGAPGATRVAAEHQLLGQALTWLSRFPTIPAQYLQGAFSSPQLIYPLPTMVAQLDPNQHAGDFWTAMGIPPRPAFYLTVTTELPLTLPIEGPLVTTEHVVYVPDMEWFNFGGLISDAAGAPVAGAVVRLEPIGISETTDADGRFVFVKVAGGANYMLRARAPGQTDVARAIQVPEPNGNYELQFP